MIISKRMNLSHLAEHIGNDATIEDAAKMRDALIAAGYAGQSVSDVPETRWLEMMNGACVPMMRTYIICAGDIVSEYRAESAEQALDTYARDAGMSDYRDLASEWGPVDSVDVLNTTSLVSALPHAAFDDAYGDGVALIDGRSYASWRDVCEQYDIDYCDYLTRVPVAQTSYS